MRKIFAIVVWSVLAAHPAAARLTRLTITRTEIVDLPVFGATGPYEKFVGTFDGELDPENPRNAVIADLALAPRDKGKVHYSATFHILKPRDAAKANGRLFYMFNNRGGKLELRIDDGTVNSNDPSTVETFGNGWLNRQGYALAWSGWDGSVVAGPNMESIALPVARNPDGSPITGTVAVEHIPESAEAVSIALPYRTAAATSANGVLTMREHSDDARIAVAGWTYDGDGRVRLPGPAKPQWIYEFVYTAKDPLVMGIGHAATRDFLTFLRDAQHDDFGTANPLAAPGGLKGIFAFGRSQGGRVQRDFIYWGFNEDEAGKGRKVFDGMMPYATGIGLMSMNARFSWPFVSSLQHMRQHVLEREGPHTFGVRTDALSGRTDGIFKRCLAHRTCPKVFNIESANEYWNKNSSLNHTDESGNDLDAAAISTDARLYFATSLQHSQTFGDRPQVLPSCQQLSNPLYQGPMFRALLAALDAWATKGVTPPPSQVPTRRAGTLVPVDAVKFPAIPATTYAGWGKLPGGEFHPDSLNPLFVQDMSVTPSANVPTKRYTTLVAQVDADGNELGGARVPLLSTPLGTYTGSG